METLFHQDERVSQWIDQVVEKLFTVCLLSGPDADSEFRTGRKAVEKIAQTLASLGIEEQNVAYGVNQLIEQRLPDTRVIGNFPHFEEILTRMIKEGIAETHDLTNAGMGLHPSEQKEVAVIAKVVHLKSDNGLEPDCQSPQEEKTIRNMDESNTKDFPREYSTEEVPFAKIPSPETMLLNDIPDPVAILFNDIPEDQDSAKQGTEPEGTTGQTEKQEVTENCLVPRTSRMDIPLNNRSRSCPNAAGSINPAVLPDSISKPGKGKTIPGGRAMRPVLSGPAPPGTEVMAFVMRQMFPDKSVRWNLTIGHQVFLAQVTNILIKLWEKDTPTEQHKKIEEQGWRIIVFEPEDLRSAHRIERQIRQANRKLR